jgi:hypothetical protein
MLPSLTTENLIAPRRQERKENFFSSNLAAFAPLRKTQFFPISFLSENLKYLWLELSVPGLKGRISPRYLGTSKTRDSKD